MLQILNPTPTWRENLISWGTQEVSSKQSLFYREKCYSELIRVVHICWVSGCFWLSMLMAKKTFHDKELPSPRQKIYIHIYVILFQFLLCYLPQFSTTSEITKISVPSPSSTTVGWRSNFESGDLLNKYQLACVNLFHNEPPSLPLFQFFLELPTTMLYLYQIFQKRFSHALVCDR